jgi:uncharacterized membrane protein (UPF0136 family)
MARARKRPADVDSVNTASPTDKRMLVVFTFLLTMTTLLPTESIGDDSLSMMVLLWLLGGAIWAYVHLKHRTDFVVGRFDWWWAVAALFIVIGAKLNMAHGDARRGLNATFAWCIYPLVFFIARDVVRCHTSRKAVVAWMMALAVGLSSYGVYQYFVGMPAVRAEFEALPEKEKTLALAQIGVNAHASSPELKQFLDRLESTEPPATFGLANSFAGFLVSWSIMAIPVLLFFLWKTNAPKQPTRLAKWFFPCGCVIVALCIVLTKSRAAWVALMVGGMVMCWFARPARKRWALPLGLLGLAATLLAVGVAVGAVDAQVLTEARVSMTYRWQYWSATLHMIDDHWFLGVGAGNFQNYYTQYKWPEASEVIADPHQFLLELWATLGLVPFVCTVAYLVWRMVGALRDLPAGESTEARNENVIGDSSAWTSGGKITPFAAVLSGGVAGCFMSVLYRLTFQQSLEFLPTIPLPVVWVLVLPVTAFTFWHLHGWIANGPWCRWWCLVAVGTLAINLLAAGGISFAAVALTIWLLLALSDECGVAKGSKRWVGVVLGGIVALVLWLMISTLNPVLQRQRHLLDFQRHLEFIAVPSPNDRTDSYRHVTQADASLQAAIQADRRSPVPPRFLAELALRRWMAEERSDDLFREALDLMVSTDPLSQRTRSLAARLALAAYTESEDPDWLDRAIGELDRAAELYPHDSMSHARRAWGYHLADRPEEAATAARLALQLDTKHDHTERKLFKQQVELLHLPPWQPLPQNWPSAEQTMRRLRRTSRN